MRMYILTKFNILGHSTCLINITSKIFHTFFDTLIYDPPSARNKNQKLVGCFLKGYFIDYYTAVSLINVKMYQKFDRLKLILVGQGRKMANG